MNAALANIIFGNETLYFLDKDKSDLPAKDLAQENMQEVKVERIPSTEKINETPAIAVNEPVAIAKEPEEIIAALPNKIIQTPTKMVDLVVIVRTYDDELKQFLAKILTAIGRSIDDIQIIDLDGLAKTNIKAVIESTNAVFSFGVPFTSLGFKADLPAYVLKMAREKHYLYADDLQTIQANANNEKRNLWDALKNILE
jgi:hypothetical protein